MEEHSISNKTKELSSLAASKKTPGKVPIKRTLCIPVAYRQRNKIGTMSSKLRAFILPGVGGFHQEGAHISSNQCAVRIKKGLPARVARNIIIIVLHQLAPLSIYGDFLGDT